MNISDIFENQAVACESLGSPFTACVLRIAAELLPDVGPVGARILGWQGDASVSADSVPLRLAGGLHALVLTGQDVGLTSVYPTSGTSPGNNKLRSAIATALTTHSNFLLDWLKSPPQTNESARSAPLVAAGALLTQRYALPLRLLELGASAGLNLRWDQTALVQDDWRIGPKDAGLTLTPKWSGDVPPQAEIVIASRAGADLNPLDPTLPEDRLRLMSYIWPDQKDRLERMQNALDLACEFPAQVTKADAIDWLEAELANGHDGVVTVIYHTVAWQYFPKDVQARGKALIEQAGTTATRNAPVAWLSMENDGTDNLGAEVMMRLWPGDIKLDLGRADFHGRWVDWASGQ